MGLFIAGVNPPTNCFRCFASYWQDFGGENRGFRCKAIPNDLNPVSNCEAREKRRDDCPFIHIPSHGRLVDLDAIIAALEEKKFSAYEDGWGRGRYLSSYCEILEEMLEELEDVPVVIGAERERG